MQVEVDDRQRVVPLAAPAGIVALARGEGLVAGAAGVVLVAPRRV